MRWRQQRDLDAGERQFLDTQRVEARVAERRIAGVFLNVLEQRAPGFEAADAAAQLAALHEGDEAGAHFLQFRQVDRNRRGRLAEAGGDGVARQRQQDGPEIRHRLLP